MNDEVTILMATYNGEKFLEEQIQSIISQSYKNWKLIIRDDCSKDSTINIIERFIQKDNRISLVKGSSNIGQIRNFNELLKIAINNKYIMFSDQDDVWKNDKIELTLNSMKNVESIKGVDEPILVYTNLAYVNKELKYLGNKNIKVENRSLNVLLGYNYVWGCTMMINNSLSKIVFPISEKADNHDYWIALHAQLLGTIYHLNEETILYRQHESNVTGGINNSSLYGKIKRSKSKIKSFTKQIEQNMDFCRKYEYMDNPLLKSYYKAFKSNRFIRLIKNIQLGINHYTVKSTIYYYYVAIFLFK